MKAKQMTTAAAALVGLVASLSVGMGDAVSSEPAFRAAAQPPKGSMSSLADGATGDERAARRWKSESFKTAVQGGGEQWCRLSVRKPFYDRGFMKTRVRIRCRTKEIMFVVAHHGFTGNGQVRQYDEGDFDGSEAGWNWNDRTNHWVHKTKFKIDWEPNERYQVSGRAGHGFDGPEWIAKQYHNTYT